LQTFLGQVIAFGHVRRPDMPDDFFGKAAVQLVHGAIIVLNNSVSQSIFSTLTIASPMCIQPLLARQ
jgi:hypothetical protein